MWMCVSAFIKPARLSSHLPSCPPFLPASLPAPLPVCLSAGYGIHLHGSSLPPRPLTHCIHHIITSPQERGALPSCRPAGRLGLACVCVCVCVCRCAVWRLSYLIVSRSSLSLLSPPEICMWTQVCVCVSVCVRESW